MSKKVLHVLPCGAIHTFQETNYSHMTRGVRSYMFSGKIPRKTLADIVNPDYHGRKLVPWSIALYAKLMNAFWKIVVEHLLNADRIIIKHKGIEMQMYIGRVPNDEHRMSKKKKKFAPEFRTDGDRYTILLDGIKHKYYFRMISKYRQQLAANIKSGKNYH